MEMTPGILDAMRDSDVERLRFKRGADGTRAVAARPDGPWEEASNLLPGMDPLLRETAALLERGGHERLDLVVRLPLGLRFLCAVHSTKLGPGAGGLRRHDLVVPEGDVIRDVLNLARSMTYKNTVAEVQRGGSKLCVHNAPIPPYDREAWLETIAEEIDLSGTITGPDSGFSPSDLEDLARLSVNVSGVRAGGTSASAALGVHEAVRATAAALGSSLNETHVVIQGLGNLGGALARQLMKEGSRLTVTDQDHRRIDALLADTTPEQRSRVGVVAPYQVLSVEADILAPCAVGGILSLDKIGGLRLRAICGGANNQLVGDCLAEEMEVARALHRHGVLYVPDWLASAGGTIHGVMESRQGEEFDPRKAEARVQRVCGWLVDELLEDAKRTGRPPLDLAIERWLE